MLVAQLVTSAEGVELVDDGNTLTLRAVDDLHRLASGSYASPRVAAALDLGLGDDAEFLGFAFTQFAMPVIARSGEEFDFAPAPNLRSPACVLPLLARSGSRCVLLAPLSNAHEQVITVNDREVRWGWHGDLDEVASGFSTTLGTYEGPTARAVLESWGAEVRSASGVAYRPPSASEITSQLSYWTDNGAAYWYRTEQGETIAESVAHAVTAMRADNVPIGPVEVDSWWYPHERSRAITEIGYPDDVPPTGLLEWVPRPDAFPGETPAAETVTSGAWHQMSGAWHRMSRDESGGDPIADLAAVCGPLVLHARHISPASPYVDDTWWVDRTTAQPSDPAFFRRWFDDAKRLGATCIEQDWMLLYWFGVREMRRVPGRAVVWQQALDEHARATDIDLIWCMATPADLIAASALDRVVAVRTSDDYRFADDPAQLWTWFLTVNRLVTPLGLRPFKDCFFSNPAPDPDDPISGDVHAELEALLAAMSGGPVGIGDRIGHTDRSIVMRTCTDDGALLQPDSPIGMIDDCLFGAPARGDRLAWATASTTIGHATWTYVVAINTASRPQRVADTLELTEIGIDSRRHVHDWRRGRGHEAVRIETELDPRDWALFVVCPPGRADIGDASKYVTAAPRMRSVTR